MALSRAEIARRYRERRSEFLTDEQRAEDREKSRKRNAKYRAAHVERLRAAKRESEQRRRYVDPERSRDAGRAYIARNREVMRARAARNYREGNAVPLRRARYRAESGYTRSQAARHRQPWSRDDDAQVLRADISIVELALLLGRTHESVKKRRTYLRKIGATS